MVTARIPFVFISSARSRGLKILACTALAVGFLHGDVITPEGLQGLMAPQEKPESPVDAAFNKGVAAFNRRDFPAAREFFAQAVKLNPNSPQGYLGLGKIAIAQGDPKAAAEPLQKAVSVAPKNTSVLLVWGNYLLWQQRYPEAEPVFKRAIESAPNSAPAYTALGDLYLLGFHRPPAAIAQYRAALTHDPGNARVHYTLANALAENGELDQAQTELESASKLAPKDPSLAEALADFYLKRHNFKSALASYADVLKMQPSFAAAHLGRGDALMATNQLPGALTEYQEALKVNPKLGAASTKIGIVYERQGQSAEAEKAYLQAIRLDTTQAPAYNNLAWLILQKKTNLDQARDWAKKAVDLAPGEASFQDTLAWVYRARGEGNSALTVLRQAAERKPPNPLIYYHLGIVCSEQRLTGDAREALKRALALSPNFEGADDARHRLSSLSAR